MVGAVIEAHLALTDIRRATDPLLQPAARRPAPAVRTPSRTPTDPATRPAASTSPRPASGCWTPPAPRTAAGFSYGPPVESVQWVTAIGARPHVGSRTLIQGDAIARGCLRTGVENLHRRTLALA